MKSSLVLPLLALSLPTHPRIAVDDNIANPATGWYRGDLHFHTNYSDDALEQGGDWMGRAIDIAEYWGDPVLTQAFPELEGRHMDFVAITDHRDIQGCFDPEMKSDTLTLICGEEFGSDGHAGAWGINQRVAHEPSDGRTPNEQIQYAVDTTRAMGGVFSPNHPLAEGDPWVWDVQGYDTIEIWNTYWTFITPPVSQERVEEAIASTGVANNYIQRAAEERGGSYNMQALRFWEGHLTVGRHVAPVGGSDRHMLVMPAEPMTYVAAPSRDQKDILDGLRNGATFVSRGPAGPQVVMSLQDRSGKKYPMGGDAPLSAGPFTLSVTVSRAGEGRLRLIEGVVDPDLDTPGGLEGQPLGEIFDDLYIAEDVQTFTVPWDPAKPAWIYAYVLEPLGIDELPWPERHFARALLDDMEWFGMDYVRLGIHLLPLMDISTLLMPADCDPADWDTDRSVCVEADPVFLGTVHIPEVYHRIFSVFQEDATNTEYAMGAISSAFMVQ